MAKRFTDTDKWKRPWFRALPIKAKATWLYILDQCDHAGIWPADFNLLSFQLDAKVSEAEFNEWFDGKVKKVDSDKYFIAAFFEFQYSNAKEGFKAKQSALLALQKYGLADSYGTVTELFPKCSEQSMDCTSISIGTSIGNSLEGGKGETKPVAPEFDFESAYAEYPLKRGKDAGMKRLRSRIKDQASFEQFVAAVKKIRN